MTFKSPLMLIFVCMLIAMMVMMVIVIALLSSTVKVKNGAATHCWTLGSLLSGSALVAFYLEPETHGVWISMLVFGAYLLGHVLHLRGLQIFFSLPRSTNLWLLAGCAMLFLYLALDHANDYQTRLDAKLLVSIIVWSWCLWKWIGIHSRPFKFKTYLGLFGLTLMIADAMGALVMTHIDMNRLGVIIIRAEKMIEDEIGELIGLLLYTASLIYCYFERYANQINYAAIHDEMTGLLNRRAILEGGQREIELSRRSHSPLAIALVDVDHFKQINDRYGHATGDLVLKELADVLQKTCRSVDLVGRFGGEEFCLILPGNHHDNVDAFAERLFSAIREHDYRPLPGVTISMGIAVLSPVDQNKTWQTLIKQADRELYKVKQNGRNNYSTAPASGPTSSPIHLTQLHHAER